MVKAESSIVSMINKRTVRDNGAEASEVGSLIN